MLLGGLPQSCDRKAAPPNLFIYLFNFIYTRIKHQDLKYDCRVIKLIIIKKETPTAGFKTNKRLSYSTAPHHYS